MQPHHINKKYNFIGNMHFLVKTIDGESNSFMITTSIRIHPYPDISGYSLNGVDGYPNIM